MLILLIGLIVIFFAARFLVFRYTANPTLSYSVAGAIVVAVVVGVLAKGLLLSGPTEVSTVAATPGPPPPTAPPGEPVVPADKALGAAQVKALQPSGKPVSYSYIEGLGGSGPKADQVASGAVMVVHGWAGDPEKKSAAAGLLVIIDGKRRFYAAKAYGSDRMDVAWSYRTMKMLRTGFFVNVPSTGLAKGAHTIALAAVSADGKHYQLVTAPPTTFTIQ